MQPDTVLIRPLGGRGCHARVGAIAGKTATKSKPENRMKMVKNGFMIPRILYRQHLEPGD